MMKNTALYVHWPFCKAKCPYCDFNSHVRESIDEQAWHHAYIKEIQRAAKRQPGATISSIFFGGGTPSLMPPALVEAIIDACQHQFHIANDCEITLEANPTSAEAEKLQGFKNAGINRLSMGVQSFNAKDLTFLGREHTADEATRAIETAQGIFDNFSFDLIYARPEQTLAQWEAELRHALSFGTPHLSLYQLTIEKGTPFYSSHRDGTFTLPEEDLATDLYLATEAIANEYGLNAYEVSNFAKPGLESRHNLAYWMYQPYIGLGPGAHGRELAKDGGRISTYQRPDPERWLESVDKDASMLEHTPLSAEDSFQEYLVMRLRLKSPITAEEYPKLHSHINQQVFAHAIKEGLLSGSAEHFAPTTQGWLVLNSLVERLIRN